MGEVTWQVEVKYEQAPGKSLTASVGADGYMHVSWDKPYLERKQFVKYELYGNAQLLASIEDPDCLTFIDKGYVGGAQSYSVRVVFTDEGVQDAWDLGFVSLENKVEFTVDRGIDRTRISWTAPVKHQCIATLNGEPLLPDEETACVEFPSAGFGAIGSDMQQVGIFLVAEAESDRTDGQTVKESFWLTSAGSQVAQNSADYGYDKGSNRLLFTDYSDVFRALSLPDFSVYKEYKRDSYSTFFSVAESRSAAYTAVFSIDGIDVVDLESFCIQKKDYGNRFPIRPGISDPG